MTRVEFRRLDRRFDRLERQLPGRAARTLRWLRAPDARWVRLPAGVLLVIGGLLSVLPILGLWMLPLGLLLLAQDVPVLRRPTSRALIWGERRWAAWRRRRQHPCQSWRMRTIMGRMPRKGSASASRPVHDEQFRRRPN